MSRILSHLFASAHSDRHVSVKCVNVCYHTKLNKQRRVVIVFISLKLKTVMLKYNILVFECWNFSDELLINCLAYCYDLFKAWVIFGMWRKAGKCAFPKYDLFPPDLVHDAYFKIVLTSVAMHHIQRLCSRLSIDSIQLIVLKFVWAQMNCKCTKNANLVQQLLFFNDLVSNLVLKNHIRVQIYKFLASRMLKELLF